MAIEALLMLMLVLRLMLLLLMLELTYSSPSKDDGSGALGRRGGGDALAIAQGMTGPVLYLERDNGMV